MDNAGDWVALQRRAVAYHEAGHAVVAAAHRYNVYQINTDGVANGDVRFCSPQARKVRLTDGAGC